MIKGTFNSIRNVFNSQISRFTGVRTILRNNFLGDRKFYCSSHVEAFRILYYGDEESALGSFLFLLHEDDVVWDIGASVGLFSVYAAGEVEKVIAFEPDPEIRARFIENVELNNFSKKIFVHENAIGEDDGEVVLNSDGVDGLSPSIVGSTKHKNSISTPVKTIDSLIGAGMDRPSVVKIDIEGAELLALRGGAKFLSEAGKPRILFIEIHPIFLEEMGSTDKEILDLLKGYGYQVISTSARRGQYHILAIPS